MARYGLYGVGRKRRPRWLAYVLCALGFIVAGVSLFTVIDNSRVNSVRLYVTVSNLPESLEGFTVLMVSDLKGIRFFNAQRALAEAARRFTYHAVVVNGDFTDKRGKADGLVELINALGLAKPIYVINGDADPAYNPYDPLDPYTAVEKAGAIWLDATTPFTYKNNTVWFTPERQLIQNRPDAQLELYNIEMSSLRRHAGTSEGSRSLAIAEREVAALTREIDARGRIQPNDLHIIIAHVPLAGERASLVAGFATGTDTFYSGIDAFLAGHYSRGSWRLPYIGAIYARGIGFFPKDGAIYGLGGVYGWPQVISGGLGPASDAPFPPFRLFNTPEVTFVTFTRYIR